MSFGANSVKSSQKMKAVHSSAYISKFKHLILQTLIIGDFLIDVNFWNLGTSL